MACTGARVSVDEVYLILTCGPRLLSRGALTNFRQGAAEGSLECTRKGHPGRIDLGLREGGLRGPGPRLSMPGSRDMFMPILECNRGRPAEGVGELKNTLALEDGASSPKKACSRNRTSGRGIWPSCSQGTSSCTDGVAAGPPSLGLVRDVGTAIAFPQRALHPSDTGVGPEAQATKERGQTCAR